MERSRQSAPGENRCVRRQHQVPDTSRFLRILTSSLPHFLTSSLSHFLTFLNSPKHVFHAIEQISLVLRIGVRPRLEFFFRERLRQLLEQVPLFFGQLLRRQHL